MNFLAGDAEDLCNLTVNHRCGSIVQSVKRKQKKKRTNYAVKMLSSDEIIAALVLKSNRIDYKANYKVGSYVVDFLIPSMHVVIEIDGDRHAMHLDSDSARDINLRAILGEKWEVVRIATSVFEKNPEKLPDAIEAIYAEKKKLRANHQGVIPEYFSKRERKHYAKVVPKKAVSNDDWELRY